MERFIIEELKKNARALNTVIQNESITPDQLKEWNNIRVSCIEEKEGMLFYNELMKEGMLEKRILKKEWRKEEENLEFFFLIETQEDNNWDNKTIVNISIPLDKDNLIQYIFYQLKEGPYA